MTSSSDRRPLSSFFGAMIGRFLARWREWTSPDRYRPERHYMRGPRPKNPNKNPNKNSDKAGGGDSEAA